MIFTTKPILPDLDAYMEEIQDLWDTRWITNMGVKHNSLEEELRRYLGAKNLTLFVNGHLALEAAIGAFNLKGEVITTPFTFISTTHAIVRSGLEPVFCDIRSDDYTINADIIETLITDRTVAIVPVHVYGNPCDVQKISTLADKYKLKVIYDAAHCFGVTLNGKSIACYGDASVFSFHATKVFNTVEGGAVACSDSNISLVLESVRNFGFSRDGEVENVGFNGKMNEFQAAMGICNLRDIEEIISIRKNIYDRYMENLDGIQGIKLNFPQRDVGHNYSYFPMVFDGYKKTRDRISEELKANSVETRKYFYPLTNRYKCYEHYKSNVTPVAEYIAERVLTLPLHQEITYDDIDRICSIIKK